MNITQDRDEATHIAMIGNDAFHGVPDGSVLVVAKKKSGIWALHSPTAAEASSISALLDPLPRNEWVLLKA